MVTILDYLNFNRQKIGLRVKSLKYNHSLLNNIQPVIQKTQNRSLPHPLFQTVMVSINFYSKIYWNTKQFYQRKCSNKNQISEKQDFSTKSIHALFRPKKKKKVFTIYFRNRDGFYKPFRWKYQNTRNLTAKIFDWQWDNWLMAIFY